MNWKSIMPRLHMSAAVPYSRWNTSGAMYTAVCRGATPQQQQPSSGKPKHNQLGTTSSDDLEQTLRASLVPQVSTDATSDW